MKTKPVVLLLSGGLDSTVLLYDLLSQNCAVHALLFNYGQTHHKELDFAKRHCRSLGVLWTEINLSGVFGACALVDGIGSVIVPNRNAVMLSIGVAVASKVGAESVCIGCNADDAETFPDCRREFINWMQGAVNCAEVNVEICAPYLDANKRQIVERAEKIGAPWRDSWSCYIGGAEPCGVCPACIKRKAAE